MMVRVPTNKRIVPTVSNRLYQTKRQNLLVV